MAEPVFLALFLLGAGVGIHVEDRENVSEAPISALIGALETNIRARTGTITAVDDLDWVSCGERDRCIEEVRARTGTHDVVVVRAYGGPRGVHVILERFARTSSSAQSAKVTLARAAEATWPQLLEPTVRALFPESQAPPTPLETAAPPEVAQLEALPWIVLGASAVALGAGVLFGVSSADAKRSLESGFYDEPAFDDLSERQRAHGTAANISFAVAIAGAATSLVLLLTD